MSARLFRNSIIICMSVEQSMYRYTSERRKGTKIQDAPQKYEHASTPLVRLLHKPKNETQILVVLVPVLLPNGSGTLQ